MNIVIIGGGNMGLTYAQSFLRSHVSDSSQISILERSPEKAEALKSVYPGPIYTQAGGAIQDADLLVLAVKPQDVPALFASIKSQISDQQVVLSIMAGVNINSIQAGLGTLKVIRAMPNLPAQVGAGMTVYTSSNEVTRLEAAMVQNLLATTGKCIYVAREEMLNAATAVSGSGPAYVFYFMQAMMDQAKQFGFSASESELLVLQTFAGAVDLFNANDLKCDQWIERVSSRGGTTEAAIQQFGADHLDEAIASGLQQANQRAEQLGKA